MMNEQIKQESDKWADEFLEAIKQLSELNAESVKFIKDKEHAKLYEQLEGFGVFKESLEEVHRHASLYKYRKKMFAKEHPPKKQKSKWDIVKGIK